MSSISENSPNQNDRFNEFLLKALFSHITAITLLVVVETLWGLNLLNDKEPPKKVEVIQSAVRVDVVALPKMTLQELKKIDMVPPVVKEEPPAPETKANETSDIEFKKAQPKVNLSNLLKDISQKKVKTRKAKAKKEPNIDRKALRKLILDGNKISKGSSATGERIDASQKEFARYIQSVADSIRPSWKLPSYLKEKDLQCRLRVYIAGNGKVLKIEVYESSGDNEYDAKAISAVKKSGLLPKPGQDILARTTSGDILLGFPL